MREGGDGQLISFQVRGVEATLRCEGPRRGPEEPRLQTEGLRHRRGVNSRMSVKKCGTKGRRCGSADDDGSLGGLLRAVMR